MRAAEVFDTNSHLASLVAQTASLLQDISDTPHLDAELLLAHVLAKPRSHLYAYPEATMSEETLAQFESVVQRRLVHEPVAYITGTKEFWSLDLIVSPSTLIPRPESELLVETILHLLQHRTEKLYLADLGTGSGAIALALASEKPSWQIIATDRSQDALAIAELNRQRLNLDNVIVIPGDWCDALPPVQFDLIVSNPPYISDKEWPHYAKQLSHEPRTALIATEEGLADIKIICKNAKKHIKSNGYIVIEHGWQQGRAVKNIMESLGYTAVQTRKDFSQHDRISVGCLIK